MNAMLQPRFAGKVHHAARAARRFFFDRDAEPHAARGAREAPAAPAARHAEGGVREGAAPPTRMQAAGIEPRDLRSLDDLGRLPLR